MSMFSRLARSATIGVLAGLTVSPTAAIGADDASLVATSATPSKVTLGDPRANLTPALTGLWSPLLGSVGIPTAYYLQEPRRRETVGVASRGVAFDQDLGTDAGGFGVVAYSRCESERGGRGEGCDLYRFGWGEVRPGMAGYVESRLDGPSSAAADEYLPSMSGEKVAFVRRVEGHDPRVYVWSAATGRTQLVGVAPRRASRVQVTSLDLVGDRVAAAWRWRSRGRTVTRVSLHQAGERSRKVFEIATRDGGELISPVFSRGFLYFGRWGERSRFYRYSVGRRVLWTKIAPRRLVSFATSPDANGSARADRVLYMTAAAGGGTEARCRRRGQPASTEGCRLWMSEGRPFAGFRRVR